MKRSEANTSTWPWDAPFSLEESLGAGGSLAGLGALSLVGSLSLFIALAWSASLEGIIGARRALAGAT